MGKNTFRIPLIQSAIILGSVIVLFAIVASSGSDGIGGAIFSAFVGIGNTIIFFIGMTIALAISISLLVAIFLASVAMVSPDQAREMYSDLKKNFAKNLLVVSEQWTCCENSKSNTDITEEESNQMRQEIEQLHHHNNTLRTNIHDLENDKNFIQKNLVILQKDNESLASKIDELSQAVEVLQISENEIKTLFSQLTTKIDSGTDEDLKEQVTELEKVQLIAHTEFDNLSKRLISLESQLNQSPTSGIFSYIPNKSDQSLFVEKVKEALSEDMTYVQIDEFLTNNLSKDLNVIIKDHPALTKNYIRNLRRE